MAPERVSPQFRLLVLVLKKILDFSLSNVRSSPHSLYLFYREEGSLSVTKENKNNA